MQHSYDYRRVKRSFELKMNLKITFLVILLACCVKGKGKDNDQGVAGGDNKKGECPMSTNIKCNEKNKCTTDNDCKGKKQCCQDACGKLQCIIPRPRERKGKCPVEEIGICVFLSSCTSDWDCKRNEKCCRNACGGRSCKPRELAKDEKNLFQCPAFDSCSSNDDCKGNKMCCPNHCGYKTCRKPDRRGKGKKECPAQRVTFPIHDQCESDYECPGRRQKCCQNKCGVKSCKKAKKIDCSRVKCADPKCGPGEIAYTPDNSCCQTCKRDCSLVRCLFPMCNYDEVSYLPEGSCCYQCKKDCSRILCALPVCKEGEVTVVPKGECCPICKEDCKGKQCHPIECDPGEVKYKPKGKCCEICKPEQPLCKDKQKPLPDTICNGIAGLPCPPTYVCDLSNVPPEVADGAGICCEATCIDDDGTGYAADAEFEKDCNTCWCLSSGQIICTKKLCRPCIQANGVEYPSGSVYKVQCNSCGCSDGIERCTKIACLGCESGYPSDQTCEFNDDCSKGFECEKNGPVGYCCKQPTCDRPLTNTYCSMDLQCPSKYYCQLDGGEEGLGFCCLDCRTVKCAQPICKYGEMTYQPEGECCKACKKDCLAVPCPLPNCKYGEELFVPEGECCSVCKKPGDCYDKEQGVIYKEGAQFKSRCNDCFCQRGLISCTEIFCSGYCESGLKPSLQEDCSTCSVEGYVCEESGLCCQEPVCSHSLPYTHCTANIGCPIGYICNFPEEEERGFCCPAPGGCYSKGKFYGDKEAVPSDDPCEHCHCDTSGEEPRIVCAIQDCAYCENGIPQEGECCPICPPVK